jgi:hypothetical protein
MTRVLANEKKDSSCDRVVEIGGVVKIFTCKKTDRNTFFLSLSELDESTLVKCNLEVSTSTKTLLLRQAVVADNHTSESIQHNNLWNLRCKRDIDGIYRIYPEHISLRALLVFTNSVKSLANVWKDSPEILERYVLDWMPNENFSDTWQSICLSLEKTPKDRNDLLRILTGGIQSRDEDLRTKAQKLLADLQLRISTGFEAPSTAKPPVKIDDVD